jgi:hypothetical protein
MKSPVPSLNEQLLEVLSAIDEGRVSASQLLASYNRQVAADLKARNEFPPLSKQYEGRSHRGITRDWHSVCTDNDCWCFGSEHHNPRLASNFSWYGGKVDENVVKLIARMNHQARASAHNTVSKPAGPKAWIGDFARARKDGFEGRIYEVHASISTVYQADQ